MKCYNDYVETTKRWLKNYSRFALTIENLQEEIQHKREMMQMDVAAPIARYDNMPSGGMPELNAVEMAAQRHMEWERDIADLEQGIEEIKLYQRKIDRALQGLNETGRHLIEGHYMQHKTWLTLGEELYYSEKWAREKALEAIKQMAFMIFGAKAVPLDGKPVSFVFCS